MIKKLFTCFLLAILVMIGYAYFTGVLSNTSFRMPEITWGGLTLLVILGLIFGVLMHGNYNFGSLVSPLTNEEWDDLHHQDDDIEVNGNKHWLFNDCSNKLSACDNGHSGFWDNNDLSFGEYGYGFDTGHGYEVNDFHDRP